MRMKTTIALFGVVVIWATSCCFAMVLVHGKGTWPDSWPKELERFRNRAKSLGVATGIQEDIHEIGFRSRKEFERAWPHILKVKTKGAPLILERGPSTCPASGCAVKAGVRILCPCRGRSGGPSEDKMLDTGPPWPDDLKLPTGGLPEYVVNDDGKWVAFDGTNRLGFIYRARVDIVLIADGEIVDLNRIPLPADTPIIDNRFKERPDVAPQGHAR